MGDFVYEEDERACLTDRRANREVVFDSQKNKRLWELGSKTKDIGSNTERVSLLEEKRILNRPAKEKK